MTNSKGRSLVASITVRNLDDQVKHRLKIQAALNNRSMEEEVRELIVAATTAQSQRTGLGTRIHQRFKQLGGVDLKIDPRTPARDPKWR